jgi:hypothetical protein
MHAYISFTWMWIVLVVEESGSLWVHVFPESNLYDFCGTLCILFNYYYYYFFFCLQAFIDFPRVLVTLSTKRLFFLLPNTSWKNIKFGLYNLPFSFPIEKIKVEETQLSESFNSQWIPTNKGNKRNEKQTAWNESVPWCCAGSADNELPSESGAAVWSETCVGTHNWSYKVIGIHSASLGSSLRMKTRCSNSEASSEVHSLSTRGHSGRTILFETRCNTFLPSTCLFQKVPSVRVFQPEFVCISDSSVHATCLANLTTVIVKIVRSAGNWDRSHNFLSAVAGFEFARS